MGAINHEKPFKTNKNQETTLKTIIHYDYGTISKPMGNKQNP